MVDVALPPGRRSDALWAGGRGLGATTLRARFQPVGFIGLQAGGEVSLSLF
jgi:hypothetical protein